MNVSNETLIAARTLRDGIVATRAAAEPGGNAEPMRPKILVVEDNLILALELEDSFREAGFDVIGVAATADQAISLAAEHRPALAIMDIRLPGKRDGIDVATVLYETYGIRSVFASAHSAPDMRERAKAVQPAGWMTKPYSMSRLVDLVREVLRVEA